MRTGLDGTGQHFPPPSGEKNRKIKDKKKEVVVNGAVDVKDP
jgi:hypothetical protein